MGRHSAGNPRRYRYGFTGAGASGWTDDKVTLFAAYKERVDGTVPVYQYHSVLPGGNRNMTYSLDGNLKGWTQDGVAFWVFGR